MMPDLTSLPAWGIFAIAVLWLVFQFLEKWQKHELDRKRKSSTPAPPSLARDDTGTHQIVTADQVATVFRDQQERAQILDTLRKQQGSIDRLAKGFERLSKAEDRQTHILDQLLRAQDATANNMAQLIKQQQQHLQQHNH